MKDKIEQAVDCLKNGGTILYPTDTIWGIGCDATDDQACRKIMQLKNRPDEKSFILLMDSFRMVEQYIPDFAEVVYELVDIADKPLTIIYPNAQKLAESVIASDGSVAIRITKDPICLGLIRGLRKPIVSTSANISASASPTCFDDVEKELKTGVDFILDERIKEKNLKASQIIKIDLNGNIRIIRH
ncbi:MAG: threonylcarbamoyl-AMP synthase [Bacteroidetes bacterium]|nr:threonylcarbamoyl-AMP synthase [Bacteroidota bacterium]